MSDESIEMPEESVKTLSKTKKFVSFAETNQFFMIEYIEPIDEEDNGNYSCPANDEIESMIAYDMESPSRLSFDGLDKSSAGTDFDTTTFKAYPRRLSVESVGPAGFSMDDVVQRLLNIQGCIDMPSDKSDVTDFSLSASGDTIIDEATPDVNTSENCNQNTSDAHASELDSDDYKQPHQSPPSMPDMSNKFLQPRVASSFSSSSDSARPLDVIRGASAILIPNQSAPLPSNLQLIFHTVASKRNSVENASTVMSTVEAAASQTTSTCVGPRVARSIEGSGMYPHEMITITVTPLSDYQPATPEESSAMNLTKPLPPSQHTLNELLAAPRCRRQERLNMRLSVVIDKLIGVEKYSRVKLLLHVFFLWVILPSSLCSLFFGAVPYDYFVNTSKVNSMGEVINRLPGDMHGSRWAVTIIPWALIMFSVATLSIEIYSSIISEIEFGIIIWRKGYYSHLQIIVASILASMTMQALIFGATGGGQQRNWLPIMASGFVSIAMVLTHIFIKSKLARGTTQSPISVRATRSFIQCLLGIFVLIFLSSTAYTVFALTYAQFSHLRQGAVGILLAFVFPFIRLSLTMIMQYCPSLQWGTQRGQMCEAMTVYIATTMWHAVYSCLVFGVKSSRSQHVTVAIAETLIQCALLIEIMRDRKLRLRKYEFNNAAVAGRKYKCDNKHTGNLSKTASWRSNRSIAVENLSTRSDEEKGANEQYDYEKTEVSCRTAGAFSCLRRNSPPVPRSRYLNYRNCADFSKEIQNSAWLGLIWTTGILTPLAFLICSTVLSLGKNQRLFALDLISPDGNNAKTVNSWTSDWEVSANLNRTWSVNVRGPHQKPSPFAYRLIGISIVHLVLLVCGSLIMSCQLSWPCDRSLVRDDLKLDKGEEEEDDRVVDKCVRINMLGVMSALLECHYVVIALCSITTMSIAFSVVFPWYGMNAAF
jgi:hypothetical protein